MSISRDLTLSVPFRTSSNDDAEVVRLSSAATADLLPRLSAGCAVILVEGQTPGLITRSEAKDLVSLLARSHTSRQFFNWKSVKPLYIRGSEAEEKLKKGLLKLPTEHQATKL